MKSILSNHHSRRSLKGLWSIVICTVLPLSLVGVSAKPLLDYRFVQAELDGARLTAIRARGLENYLSSFGEEGPPTQGIKQIENVLVQRIPFSFEQAEFLHTCVAATRGLDVGIDSVVSLSSTDTGLPVGDLSLFIQACLIKGRMNPTELGRFLEALHREGHPVEVQKCTLSDPTNADDRAEFQLQLGVFFRAQSAVEEAEIEESDF